MYNYKNNVLLAQIPVILAHKNLGILIVDVVLIGKSLTAVCKEDLKGFVLLQVAPGEDCPHLLQQPVSIDAAIVILMYTCKKQRQTSKHCTVMHCNIVTLYWLLPLAIYIACMHACMHVHILYEEVYQEGCLGVLLRAVVGSESKGGPGEDKGSREHTTLDDHLTLE